MQPIERYGLIALIFLGITIAAACLWEPKEEASAEGTEVAKATAEHEDRAPAERDFVGARSRPRQGQSLSAKQKEKLLALEEEVRRARFEGDAVVNTGANQGTRRSFAGMAGVADEGRGSAEDTEEKTVRTHIQEKVEDVAETVLTKAKQVKKRFLPERPRPAKHTYEIKPGDTLSEVSLSELGTSRRWKEIVELNPGLDPNRLREGTRIVLPADAASSAAIAGRDESSGPAKTRREPAPKSGGQKYAVRQDDSLWKIAALTLGDGSRWKEIADLNPDINPDRITAGMTLVLPGGAKLASESNNVRVAQATPQATPERSERRVR